MEENPKGRIGDNNPPGMIETCAQVAKDTSDWLAEHPVISTYEEAQEGKVHRDRSNLTLKDMEVERANRVGPLNEQVRVINDTYRPVRLSMENVIDTTNQRIYTFLLREEARKAHEAREALRIAQEAADKAADAADRDRDAKDSASQGEAGLDLLALGANAAAAKRAADVAARQAERADRETKAKVTGGFTRAASLRKVKTYHLAYGENRMEAAVAALRAVGVTDDISIAIIKAAKAYHEEYGEIPPGIMMHEERKL